MGASMRQLAVTGTLLLGTLGGCLNSFEAETLMEGKPGESVHLHKARLVHNARVLLARSVSPVRSRLEQLLSQTAVATVRQQEGKMRVEFLEGHVRGRVQRLLGVAFLTPGEMDRLPGGERAMALYNPEVDTALLRESKDVGPAWEAVSFLHELLHALRKKSRQELPDPCAEEALVRVVEGEFIPLFAAGNVQELWDRLAEESERPLHLGVGYPELDGIFGRARSEEERQLRDSMVHIQVLFARERQKPGQGQDLPHRLGDVYCGFVRQLMKE